MKLPIGLLAALLSPFAHAEGQFTGSSVIASAPRPAAAAAGLPAVPPSTEPSPGGALWFPFAKVAEPTAHPPKPAVGERQSPTPAGFRAEPR